MIGKKIRTYQWNSHHKCLILLNHTQSFNNIINFSMRLQMIRQSYRFFIFFLTLIIWLSPNHHLSNKTSFSNATRFHHGCIHRNDQFVFKIFSNYRNGNVWLGMASLESDHNDGISIFIDYQQWICTGRSVIRARYKCFLNMHCDIVSHCSGCCKNNDFAIFEYGI